MAEDMVVDTIMPRVLSAAQKGKGKVEVNSGRQVKGGPWVEKYRPTSLADVAAHKDIIDTIDRLTGENRLPHLLLYGPPGTGKTSTILAVARKLYGAQYQNMILELNASDDRGIDVVRQQVQDFASTKSISFGPKVNVKLVILDEADAMTKEAQFALRRVIEKYTKSTRFCLICNYASKIIPALQSRCTRFRFAPLDPANVTERLRYVIQQEGLDVTDGGLAAIVRLVNGDLRKALNILQSAQMASPHLTEEAVYLCTGNPMPKDIEQIAFWLLNEPFSTSYQSILHKPQMILLCMCSCVFNELVGNSQSALPDECCLFGFFFLNVSPLYEYILRSFWSYIHMSDNISNPKISSFRDGISPGFLQKNLNNSGQRHLSAKLPIFVGDGGTLLKLVNNNVDDTSKAVQLF